MTRSHSGQRRLPVNGNSREEGNQLGRDMRAVTRAKHEDAGKKKKKRVNRATVAGGGEEWD